jgi:hypothetical protein
MRFGLWLILGLIVYFSYSRRHCTPATGESRGSPPSSAPGTRHFRGPGIPAGKRGDEAQAWAAEHTAASGTRRRISHLVNSSTGTTLKAAATTIDQSCGERG